MSTRAATVCLAALGFAPVLTAHDGFDATRHFPLTDRGLIRVVADMDVDGDADLVWIGKDTLQVYWNDGDGEFTPGPLHVNGIALDFPKPGYGPQVYPQAGDVTGDGLPDVVVGAHLPYPHAALVVFKNLGGGAFADSMTDLPDPPGLGSGWMLGLALGNVDADPALEVATVHDASVGDLLVDVRAQVTWWNWHGSTLAANAPLVISGPMARLLSIVPVDLGNDGITDLVGAGNSGSYAAGQVQVLPTVAGTATLGASWTIEMPELKLESGDIDSDGDVDVVGCGRKTCSETIIQAFVDVGGAFAKVDSAPIAGPACDWETRIVLGDFDGDGDMDAFENDESARAFWNDGAAHFTAGGTQASEPDPTYGYAAAGCTDLDGDGRADLVAARAILFGHAAPLADPIVLSGPLGAQTRFLVADLEGDGDLDMLTTNGAVGMNNGTGAFTAVTSTWPTFPGKLVSLSGPWAAGDFDGDGRMDVFASRVDGPYFSQVFVGMELLLDAGNGQYVDAGTPILPPGFSGLTDGSMRLGADVDGDGDLDVASGGGYFRNDGVGTTWPFVSLYAATDTLAVADADGDGDMDALTTIVTSITDDPASITLMRNDGGLAFTPVLLQPSAPDVAAGSRLLDLDDDGDLDVAVPLELGTVAMHLFENLGGCSFGPSADVASTVGLTRFVGAGDVDGDGLTDLVCDRFISGSYQTGELMVAPRTGPGLAYGAPRYWIGRTVAALDDVDEDGDLDAIGVQTARSQRFSGAADGIVLQYGAGSPGTGGARPVLGADGPVRSGSTTASVHLRRAIGGGEAFAFLSAAGPASLLGVVPGGILLVKPPVILLGPIPLTGTPGATGTGGFDADVTAILPSVAGTTFWHQVFVADPSAAGGIAASNGLAIAYGF